MRLLGHETFRTQDFSNQALIWRRNECYPYDTETEDFSAYILEERNSGFSTGILKEVL